QDHSGTLKNSLLQVDQSCVRNSYDVFSLLRLHRAQCAIKQTQVTVQKIGREIEEKLRCASTRNELKKESECLQLKILVLRDELERQRKALGQEVASLQKQKITLLDRENSFGTEYEKLGERNESLSELRKEGTAKREQLLKTNAQQNIRCKQLLSELSYIYPIDLNDQKDYFVCGVKLPNSEDFQAKDDGSIAVALGYTAHLVSMISFFLQVPLRYPIIHKGSRSTIKDNINDKLTEKEREFPLYPKGGEKLQFEYGVYLLNKNIAQLRYQHGLSTPDLRQTLPNLKNFMEIGLMVRCDRHHTSSAIPVPKRPSSTSRLPAAFPSPDKGLRPRAGSGHQRLPPASPPAPQLPLPREPAQSPLSSSLDTSRGKSQGLNGQSWASPRGRQDSWPGGRGAINGAEPRDCGVVEQAEEILGLEATGLSSEEQLEDFNSLPVERAVAVECDEQVLGEFEEFSRRIYALNENVAPFRRPRKGSDK
ncbi:UVRAG protein, partial [Neodrepanis coruscans]|nr:UVRAG protein [Neodrepanis coruscans]